MMHHLIRITNFLFFDASVYDHLSHKQQCINIVVHMFMVSDNIHFCNAISVIFYENCNYLL